MSQLKRCCFALLRGLLLRQSRGKLRLGLNRGSTQGCLRLLVCRLRLELTSLMKLISLPPDWKARGPKLRSRMPIVASLGPRLVIVPR